MDFDLKAFLQFLMLKTLFLHILNLKWVTCDDFCSNGFVMFYLARKQAGEKLYINVILVTCLKESTYRNTISTRQKPICTQDVAPSMLEW